MLASLALVVLVPACGNSPRQESLPDQPFDAEVWRQGDSRVRAAMMHSLTEDDLYDHRAESELLELLGEPDSITEEWEYELDHPDSRLQPTLQFSLVVSQGEGWPRACLWSRDRGGAGLANCGPGELTPDAQDALRREMRPEVIEAWCAATPSERAASWEAVRDWVNSARPAKSDYQRLLAGADSHAEAWYYAVWNEVEGSSDPRYLKLEFLDGELDSWDDYGRSRTR